MSEEFDNDNYLEKKEKGEKNKELIIGGQTLPEIKKKEENDKKIKLNE